MKVRSSKKVLLSLLCAVFVLTIGLVGCQANNPGPSASSVSTSSPSASSAAVASSNPSTKNTTVALWEIYGPSGNMDKVVKAFNDQNNGVTINDVYYPSQETLDQKMQVAANSNDKPDLLVTDMINIPIFKNMVSFVDLNTYINQPDSTLKASDFYPASQKFATFDGKLLGLKFTSNDIILFYNKKLFKDAGLDPNSPPQTWDELVSDGQKLTKDGQLGLDFDATTGNYYEFWSWEYQCFVWQNGGDMWNADFTAPAFNTPAGVGAMQFMCDLFNKYKIASLTPPQNGFDNGKVAMTVTGTWMAGQYLSELKDDLGACPLPKNQASATNVGGEMISMLTSNSAQQDASWKALEYLMGSDAQMLLCQAGKLPGTISLNNSSAFQTIASQNIGIKVSVAAMPDGKYRAPIAQYNACSQALAAEIQNAIANKETAQQAVDTATKNIQSILAGKS